MNECLYALLVSVIMAGCASVVSTATDGHPNRERVPIVPGATAKLMTGTYEDDDKDGWVVVPRGAGAFRGNNGIAEKDGYTVGHIISRPSPWLLGNIVSPLPIGGALVDVGVGGGWDIDSYPVGPFKAQ